MKIINENFNTETNETTVTISGKHGIYTGVSKLHPKDAENYSYLFGCRLAEYRAIIKMLKAQRKRKKIMLEAIQNLNKDMIVNNVTSKDALSRVHFKLRDYTNEIESLTSDIEYFTNLIKSDIEFKNKFDNKKRPTDN